MTTNDRAMGDLDAAAALLCALDGDEAGPVAMRGPTGGLGEDWAARIQRLDRSGEVVGDGASVIVKAYPARAYVQPSPADRTPPTQAECARALLVALHRRAVEHRATLDAAIAAAERTLGTEARR